MMFGASCRAAAFIAVALLMPAAAPAGEIKFRVQEIFNRLSVGYATRLVDMNDDGKLDIVVVDTERVIWLQNPDWQVHTLVEHATKKDNVSIAESDIDGDGKMDFALAADWRPSDTRTSGTLQWLARGKTPDEPWTVHPIGVEPTLHRIRFADLDGDGRDELVGVPLFGRGSSAPNFAESPLRILAYKIPADPVKGLWTPTVINEELHVAHNFWPTDLDRDGRLDMLVASFEGVSLLKRGDDGQWRRTLIGAGNQATSPNRGASEIKHGRLASGEDYLATIEPWHGFQVVVYTPPKSGDKPPDGLLPGKTASPMWRRTVLDEALKWGHAVWCADLDGDRDQELIIGVRDTKDAANPCGLRIYDPAGDDPASWKKHVIDPGGVAIEDLAAGDLDGDGRGDIVAVGRATKNVRVYWNETPPEPSAATDKKSASRDEFPRETLVDSDGGKRSLVDSRGKAASVLVSLSVECPISSEYISTVIRLAERYRPRGVNFIGIDPNASETESQMAAYAREHRLPFPFLKDEGAKVARRLLLQVTPEVCVFDSAGAIVYRGRIDDRYRAGGASTGATPVADLERALEEVLAGKNVSVARTKAMGCPIQ